MRALKPFAPVPISVEADLKWSAKFIDLQFKLSGKDVLDAPRPVIADSWPRGDELWKTTCFEAFFAIKGQINYWELNLSPAKHQWNLYSFDEYRKPQPPRAAHDLELMRVEVTASSLTCRLHAGIALHNLEWNLCAVIRTIDATNYFSLLHGAQPDFHWRGAFRSSPVSL